LLRRLGRWLLNWSKRLLATINHLKLSVKMLRTMRIDRPVEPGDEPIPDDISITELAEQIVRGKIRLSQPQMRMLIELLPYYAPKLTAVAVGWQKGEDFYTRLDRAVNASEKAKLIEGKVILNSNDTDDTN